MSKIIVTGVDGNFGGHAAETILERVPKEELIFTSPNAQVLEKYRAMGIDARYANYTDPSGLVEAFSGGDTLLFISVPQVGEKRRMMHKNAIDAAVKAGVKKIVYTSIVGAGVPENEGYEIFDHKFTEKYILDSGMNYVFMRNSQYCEAMISSYEQAAGSTGILENNMGEGRMAHVARSNCAEAAACAAAGAAGDNCVYYISGPTANTIADFIAMGNEATGGSVSYKYIDDEEMWAFFDSKFVPRKTEGDWSRADPAFPFCSDGMVTFGRAIRLGQMNNCTDDYEKLTGRKPLSVREVFADIENHRVGKRTNTD